MSLTVGARIGGYEILDAIGAGGMGEVYRARDTRLKRDVAIKVLPDALARDPDRVARFAREAELVAALNHPNIAAVYGLEEQSGTTAIVLELVEGETLAARIERGAVPVNEALDIARQIAAAFEAAHERGIIHRDLKPANVKLAPDGTVKVLDFGLAKALDPAGRALSDPATLTSPVTMTQGLILGTAAYMAPEQAVGKPVDKRADIWAFGCVVFEMLTGRRLFQGESVTETLAAVMCDEIRFDALPASIPPSVVRVLTRCLQRDPKQRLRDIGDARLELDSNDPPGVAPSSGSRPHWIAVSGLILAALAIGIVARSMFGPAQPTPRVNRLDIGIGTADADPVSPVISPDGSRIAYVVHDHLMIRELSQIEPRDLGAVPTATYWLSWSPDSATIAFAAGDGRLRRIASAGGPIQVICDIPDAHRVLAIAWIDQTIVFAAWRGSVYRVDAHGGTPAVWLALNPQTEVDFHGVAALPAGRIVMATHRKGNEYPIETFDGTNRTVIEHSPSMAGRIAYSSTGHLLVTRFDTNPGVWAYPFDGKRMDAAAATLIAPGFETFSVASDHTFFGPAPRVAAGLYELAAVGRDGTTMRAIGPPAAALSSPVVSPDGRRVAVVRGPSGRTDVWVHATAAETANQLTFSEGPSSLAWFPKGDRIAYVAGLSTDQINQKVSSITADGSGQRQTLAAGSRSIVSSDGEHLLVLTDERGTNHLRDVKLRGTSGPANGERIFRQDPEPNVQAYALSPDARTLAFVEHGETGVESLFLTRFPSGEGRWQLHVVDGGDPLWHSSGGLRWVRDTGELFFAMTAEGLPERGSNSRGRIMSVSITSKESIELSEPKQVYQGIAADLQGGFDVSPDGKTIYVRRRVGSSQNLEATKYVIVQNWPSLLAK